jgi:hypothetical protein
MVWGQASSNSHSAGQQHSTYLERRLSIVKSSRRHGWNRQSGSSLPDILQSIVRETNTMSLTRHYWFGLLDVRVVSDETWKESQSEDDDFDTSTTPLRFQFIFAPHWRVSDTVIKVAMDSSMGFSVRRSQVNLNPNLLECLKACEIESLKNLFSRGKAKPTDLVLDSKHPWEIKPESLFEVNLFLWKNMNSTINLAPGCS